MTDDELLAGFASARLGAFSHRDHVRVAWLLLGRMPFDDAAATFARSLRALAAAHGAPEKYHATITWAYVVLVAERMESRPAATFDAFAAENADLLDHASGLLRRHYDAATLASDVARRIFVLPRARDARGDVT